MATQTEIMKARANSFAAKLSASEELQQDVERGAEAKNYVRRGPMIVKNDLIRIFTLKGILTMPVPDSEGGNNPDLYPIEGTKRKGSFYNDLYDATTWGKALAEKLEKIKLAQDANTQEEAGEPWSEMTDIQLDEEADKLKKKRTYERGVIKNAVALAFKLEELKAFPEILVQERVDADGSESTSPQPYTIRNADMVNAPDEYKMFSVDTINKLDIKKIAELGGTFKAVRKSLKRDDGDTDKVNLPELRIETAGPYAERFGQLLDRVVSTDALEARLVQYLSSEQGQSDLIWYSRIEKQLAGIMSSAGLRQKAAKLEAELDDTPAQSAA